MNSNLIKSLQEIENLDRNIKILTIFSGGLDGTYLLGFLKNKGFRTITALTIDIGNEINANRIESNMKKLGINWLRIDKTEEFILEYIIPSIQANSRYFGGHPISASISRPLISSAAVQIAKEQGYDVILHTSNPSQNSLRRFNNSIFDLNFKGRFGSPFEASFITRDSKTKFLAKYGISYPDDSMFSQDNNIWVREFEYGNIDNPEKIDIPEDLYQWTNQKTIRKDPEDITIGFRNGIPNSIDGKQCNLKEMINHLNIKIGSHGIGRYIGLEEIAGNYKVLEVREAPAATVLMDAYQRIESACLPISYILEKKHIENIWIKEASEGKCFDLLFIASTNFIKTFANKINGQVTYRLGMNSIEIKSIIAAENLYIKDREAFEDKTYNGLS